MATKIDLVMDQGATFSTVIAIDDISGVDLIVDGMTADSKMKKYFTASNSVTISTELANGMITLSLTANQTVIIDSGRYVYDVFLNDTVGNNVLKIIEGIITVTPKVT